ncbi:hypothetical protein CHUAL_009102 [Chamberlinius hualienensis]
MGDIDHKRLRYPYSIVWTPIPLLTWLFPFIGHCGICTSEGVITDFAGPYFVSEDNMAFGNPTRYLVLDVNKVPNGEDGWDKGVAAAANVYRGRMHNLFCDNCHSHVSCALNSMGYGSSWNMVKLAAVFFFKGKYVSFWGFLKTWLPFLLLSATIVTLSVLQPF